MTPTAMRRSNCCAGRRYLDGFLAEHRYYRSGPNATGQRSLVDWGSVSSQRMNEWVTVRALKVLQSRTDS